MIEFECPECGEPLEISDRMAGKRVRCVGCDERIEVPERSRERAPRRRRVLRDAGLSGQEFLLYTLLFVFIPVANVFVSSILYYVWRGSQPRRANQINLLGFAVFGFHILLYVSILFIGLRLRR
jgi:DNA-directed RNA polymerase subunit RPC12/RpoP